MSIFETFLLFVAVFVAGFLYGGYYVVDIIRKHAEKELIINEIANTLKIEKYKDIYYMYEQENETFVCQGNTLEETFSALVSCGIHDAYVLFDDKKFIVKDGNVMELLK